jgi:hypothetical protein
VLKITASLLFKFDETLTWLYFLVLALDYLVTSIAMLSVMFYSLKKIKKMTTDCPELESNETNFNVLLFTMLALTFSCFFKPFGFYLQKLFDELCKTNQPDFCEDPEEFQTQMSYQFWSLVLLDLTHLCLLLSFFSVGFILKSNIETYVINIS